jgi:hypothetical protein
MSKTFRRLGLSVLVLGLYGAWGCGARSGNEDEFAKYPGTTPPGTKANSEEVAPAANPAPKKAS